MDYSFCSYSWIFCSRYAFPSYMDLSLWETSSFSLVMTEELTMLSTSWSGSMKLLWKKTWLLLRSSPPDLWWFWEVFTMSAKFWDLLSSFMSFGLASCSYWARQGCVFCIIRSVRGVIRSIASTLFCTLWRFWFEPWYALPKACLELLWVLTWDTGPLLEVWIVFPWTFLFLLASWPYLIGVGYLRPLLVERLDCKLFYIVFMLLYSAGLGVFDIKFLAVFMFYASCLGPASMSTWLRFRLSPLIEDMVLLKECFMLMPAYKDEELFLPLLTREVWFPVSKAFEVTSSVIESAAVKDDCGWWPLMLGLAVCWPEMWLVLLLKLCLRYGL